MRRVNQILGAKALKATASRSKLEDADAPRGLQRRRFRWLAPPAACGAWRRRRDPGAASTRPARRSGTPRSCPGWGAPGLFCCFYVPLFGMLDILALTREWHLIKADNVKTSTSLCDGLFNTKYRLPGNLILRGITAPGPGCGFLMGLQCMPIDSWGCLQVKYVRELTRQFVILKQQRLFSENAQRIPVSHSQGFAGGKK